MELNRVFVGDVLDFAKTLEPQSIQCIVTSPPYFNLRSYLDAAHPDKAREIGGEPTPAAFVAALVAVFRALKPALKDDGTCWIVIGDSFAGGKTGRDDAGRDFTGGGGNRLGSGNPGNGIARGVPPGLKQKDLIGIPWRVAFALQEDGWYLRSDIIWAKKNCMPESVTDRPTRSHEHIFLLTKNARYFYDAESIKEPGEFRPYTTTKDTRVRNIGGRGDGYTAKHGGAGFGNGGTRNKRDVWTVSTVAYPESHFATFPPELIRPCILAGTSAHGECSACGRAWVRVVEREGETPRQKQQSRGSSMYVNGQPHNPQGLDHAGGHGNNVRVVRDLGWQPQCSCPPGTPIVPQTVLDPFCGSGTTALVATQERRLWVACDLDERSAGWTAARLAGAQTRMGWADVGA